MTALLAGLTWNYFFYSPKHTVQFFYGPSIVVLKFCSSWLAGLFLYPTIFTDVTDEMFIAKEESFGPVMIVSRFPDGLAVLFIYIFICMLHRSWTWSLKRKNELALHKAEMRTLRYVYGEKLRDRLSVKAVVWNRRYSKLSLRFKWPFFQVNLG